MNGSGKLPRLDTLVEDIYGLFDPDIPHKPSEDNLDVFAENLKSLLRVRLGERERQSSPLRFSALGKPDRQIWMEAHPDGNEEPLSKKTYFKFLYGDIIEELVLFLAKESGHSVERTQEEVSVDGVKGHIDAVIDGVVVDVKSASSHGYKKFRTGDVISDDPFGYVQQLAGYAAVLTPEEPAAWVAMDKVSASLCVATLSPSIIRSNPPAPRIEHLKEVIKADVPPQKCYPDVPDGKSGNRKLDTGCAYCKHKFRCWPGVRKFLYSTGPRYLTHVARAPDVPEVSPRAADDE